MVSFPQSGAISKFEAVLCEGHGGISTSELKFSLPHFHLKTALKKNAGVKPRPPTSQLPVLPAV
jgi:hypothetical protein